MDSTTLLSVVGGVLVLSIIILTSLCLHCKGSSQTKYITQSYQQPSQLNQGFTVIRPHAENPLTTTLPTQTSLHQHVNSPLISDPRRSSACPSSTGSDYVNQNTDNNSPGYELPPEKNQDYPDYLDVLPDDTHLSQQSLASSANSGQNYENVPESSNVLRDVYDFDEDDDDDDDDDGEQYINVKPGPELLQYQFKDFQTPVGSYGSSDGHDSSDYVNAPNQVISHLGLIENS
ncbi:linker for activation of T-cells family member 1 isoform X2 [Salminus brasiliensis]|uniref:linker for activation of T-cells family member 1 isoform X2 n=1 Tax=Salminus brasiliensis TaxID=930266 RepID=UPI003B83849E